MRKIFAIIALSLFAFSLSGCGCNRPFANLFNRGGSCAPVDPCANGPRATLFGGGQIPPGAEVLQYPAN
jgi:hypothetical protein